VRDILDMMMKGLEMEEITTTEGDSEAEIGIFRKILGGKGKKEIWVEENDKEIVTIATMVSSKC
jgi:hypothetical protein